MSKDIAVINPSGKVIAINVYPDDYNPQPNEVEIVGTAWVNGDYIDNYFYPPQPFPSWTRHEGEWLPPVPMPLEGMYMWNEESGSWDIIENDQ